MEKNILEELITRIEKLKPHPTEAITLFYDMKTPHSQIYKVMEFLRKEFPDNKVIALPDNVGLESCSKDVLENIISMIAVIIEQL